jgi:hypothetical protein
LICRSLRWIDSHPPPERSRVAPTSKALDILSQRATSNHALPLLSMTTRTDLLDDLQRAYDGDPWHGSSLSMLLRGINATDAAALPIPGAHSIWAIVLHLTAWTDEVRLRLGGKTPSDPPQGDWPAVPSSPTPSAWRHDRAALATAHRALEDAVSTCPPRRFATPVGNSRDPALGTGLTYAGMVRGLVQHHAYHGGQIALLRRALRTRS